MFPLPILHYFEWAALICSVLVYAKTKHTPMRWLLPFLFYMVLTETLGRYIRTEIHKPNAWLYNLYLPVEALIYSFLFYKYAESSWFKKSSFYFICIIPFVSVGNMLFGQGFFNFNTRTNTCFTICLLVLNIMYFVDIFISERIISPLKEPMFWIAMGLLFYNLGGLAYTLAFDYILANKMDVKAKLFGMITQHLIYVLYSCIVVALLLTRNYEARSK
jgi:hypothetical protein